MFILPKLPYAYAALEPVMSADTLHTHHDKHHKTYVEKTNDLAAKAGLADQPLEDLVREAHRNGDKTLFNNAAQAWNHAFFWESMAAKPAAATAALKSQIEQAFGGWDKFKIAFVEAGVNHFGSGWVWLAAGSEGLQVISTHDAEDTLIREGLVPLLVCDLWEHAYYLDYKNDRKAFLGKWLEGVANWAFVERQLAAARGHEGGFRYPAPIASDNDADAADRQLKQDRPSA